MCVCVCLSVCRAWCIAKSPAPSLFPRDDLATSEREWRRDAWARQKEPTDQPPRQAEPKVERGGRLNIMDQFLSPVRLHTLLFPDGDGPSARALLTSPSIECIIDRPPAIISCTPLLACASLWLGQPPASSQPDRLDEAGTDAAVPGCVPDSGDWLQARAPG